MTCQRANVEEGGVKCPDFFPEPIKKSPTVAPDRDHLTRRQQDQGPQVHSTFRTVSWSAYFCLGDAQHLLLPVNSSLRILVALSGQDLHYCQLRPDLPNQEANPQPPPPSLLLLYLHQVVGSPHKISSYIWISDKLRILF